MQPLLVASLYSRNHELNILESTLLGVTSIEVSTILVKLKMPHKNFNNSKLSPLKEIVPLYFLDYIPLYSIALCQVFLN